MDSETKHTYFFNDNADIKRLDVYINSLHPEISRSQIQKLIRNKSILINGKNTKASYNLSQNDLIELTLTSLTPQETPVFQQNIPVEIIFEDEHLIVVNKQIGLVTHPGAGNPNHTLVNALYDKLLKNDPIRPGVVHRLDKDTSGLLVLAKTQISFDSLIEQFKSKTANRIYWALCFGKLKNQKGILKTNLARDSKNRKKFSSQKQGKLAITHYKVLKEGPLSLIELSLETGRTHQIRVHLSEIGHPILNDSIYGSNKKINDLHDPVLKSRVKRIKRLALIAKELSLIHPISKENLFFKVPWPTKLDAVNENI